MNTRGFRVSGQGVCCRRQCGLIHPFFFARLGQVRNEIGMCLLSMGKHMRNLPRPLQSETMHVHKRQYSTQMQKPWNVTVVTMMLRWLDGGRGKDTTMARLGSDRHDVHLTALKHDRNDSLHARCKTVVTSRIGMGTRRRAQICHILSRER